MSIRRATHSGSWYTDSSTDHAGYQYSGSVSAFAYRQVSPIVVKRIFILGPSHHVRLSGCALSPLTKYLYNELYATEHFETMSVAADEDEHSIEMHLPYIAKVMEDFRDQFTIVPILVGSLSQERESLYGRILAPYLADPQNLFVVSSDFCHWGQRFRYTYYDRAAGEIWQSIQKLDKQGMNLIETLNPSAFSEYLRKYGNTICGRHPIGVLLNAISNLQKTNNAHHMSLKFLQYAQSSHCYCPSDSSVSYAAASLIFE
ncbi:Protein MEMO1 [Armadillidium nasatum]|uniref:Protein MEMO1 n=1 Tax=Armadillidium nasatum TaxID=96803 RepID=A0A5N5TCI6_9CRUS|nr:Protein MEMO1 [Armadillidium nasatum]